MSTFTTKVAGRIAVAAVLSLGITAGSIGIASASSNGHGRFDHASAGSSWTYANRVNGVVTGYVAGASITIAPRGGTTATTYTLTSATTIAGLATGASLVNNDVSLTLSTTTPTTVVSIKVEAPRVKCINGVVTGYVAGASITIALRGGTTATTYTLTSATTIAGFATGASLVNNDVSLTLSTTTPTTVVSIKVEAPRVKCDGTNSHSPLSAHASDGHQAFGHGSNHHSSARFANFHR